MGFKWDIGASLSIEDNNFRSHDEEEAARLFEQKKYMDPFDDGVLGRKITEGSHADVYELNNPTQELPNLIVKVGKTEHYAPPLLKALNIKFTREKISRLLQRILGPEFKIYPDEDFINNGMVEYLLIKQYFGNTDEYDDWTAEYLNYTGNLKDESLEGSESIRQRLISSLANPDDSFYQELKNILGDDDSVHLIKDTIGKHESDNFLPRERTIVGQPPTFTREQAEEYKARGKELPVTFYIVQERISGEGVVPLEAINEEDLIRSPELTEKLCTFAVLAKKLYSDTGKLIDLRPEEVAKHPFEWFQKTTNILVNKETADLYFVDTRWLYDRDGRLGRGGINIIEQFGVNSIDRSLKKYVNILKKERDL